MISCLVKPDLDSKVGMFFSKADPNCKNTFFFNSAMLLIFYSMKFFVAGIIFGDLGYSGSWPKILLSRDPMNL